MFYKKKGHLEKKDDLLLKESNEVIHVKELKPIINKILL